MNPLIATTVQPIERIAMRRGLLLAIVLAVAFAPTAEAKPPVEIRDGQTSTLIRVTVKPGQTVDAISPPLGSRNIARLSAKANGRHAYYDSNGRTAYVYGQGLMARLTSSGRRLRVRVMNASPRVGTIGIRLWTDRQVRRNAAPDSLEKVTFG